MLWQIVLSVILAFAGFGVHRALKAKRVSAPTVPLHVEDMEGSEIVDDVKTSIDTIFAIGDLHGDARCAREWVEATGLVQIDEDSMRWTDPGARLVFLGDYCDKGPTSKQVIEFVKSLTDTFPNEVKAAMGNHELELLLDREGSGARSRMYFQLPYATVHPDEYLNYMNTENVTENTTMALNLLYNLARDEIYAKNKLRSTDFSPRGPKSVTNLIVNATEQEIVRTELEKMQDAYINAYKSTTELGHWVEQRDIVIEMEGMLFLHAGIQEALFTIPDGLTGLEDMLSLNEEFKEVIGSGYANEWMKTLRGQMLYDLVQYRGNHQNCLEVENVLERLGGTRIIVGHTPDDSVRVKCGGKFIAADSALGRWIRTNGNQYCRGDVTELSSNRQFKCDAIEDRCGGQILKMEKNNGGDNGGDGWTISTLEI